MKRLALAAAIVFAGCATTGGQSDSDQRIRRMEQQSAEIAQRERNCMAAVSSASSDDAARMRCKAEAEREKEALALRERQEYQQQGEEERRRSSRMMILTTSRPP
jgi:hypothetical protein